MNKDHYTKYQEQLVPLFKQLEVWRTSSPSRLSRLVAKFAKPGGAVFSKEELLRYYKQMAGSHGLLAYQEHIAGFLLMKPVRTQSGVTPVTVLTKPFPCPGKCIFCPSDIRMPKSYLSDEPGAQRAERNWFDPYLQTINRLKALSTIGHHTDKVEIIVLGGTWSYYPENYQIWFIMQCFKAMNDFGDNRENAVKNCENIVKKYESINKLQLEHDNFVQSANPEQNKRSLDAKLIDGTSIEKTYNQVVSELYVGPEHKMGLTHLQSASWPELLSEQKRNETAKSRCVGLVIETRPDNISEAEVIRIRKLGCTKAQIGFQSLQDDVLRKNKRGHDVAATRKAVKLLRLAGFKIHAHWMANLYGSSVKLDQKDYDTLFDDPDFRPDELKIYPCSLIGSAELMSYYKRGEWKPYTKDELLTVLEHALMHTPEYCRLTRVIRDIPSQDIVEGNKLTNFRQITEQALASKGLKSSDIRAREIRSDVFEQQTLRIHDLEYKTSCSTEHFLEVITPENRIVGFLRLSLPTEESFISELKDSAMIREVHVYGKTTQLGKHQQEKAQHMGLGTQLIALARELAHGANYPKVAVISAVGTREYYRKLGFTDGELYQFIESRPLPYPTE